MYKCNIIIIIFKISWQVLSELYYNNIVNLIQTNKVRHMQLCVIKITDSFVFSIGLIVTGLTSLRGACLIIVVYTSIVYTNLYIRDVLLYLQCHSI